MKKLITILAALIVLFAVPAFAQVGANYVVGTISNYTSTASGLLIAVNTGVPQNCAGVAYNWMIISQTDKAMLAMALTRISQDKLNVILYSDGVRVGGACRITQYDPN